MSRYKRRDVPLLGEPLPLPYKVLHAAAADVESRAPSTHTIYPPHTDADDIRPLKRILVGRLRKTNASGGNWPELRREDHKDTHIRNFSASRVSSNGSSSSANPSNDNDIHNHKASEPGTLSVIRSIHAKLEQIESALQTLDGLSHWQVEEVETRLEAINLDLDELTTKVAASRHHQNQDDTPATQPSVFDELDRLRNSVQHSGTRLRDRLSLPYKTTVVVGASIVVLCLGSYILSDLSYEYCYYYC